MSKQRSKLWEEFILLGNSISLPRLVLGDFNSFSRDEEKIGYPGVQIEPCQEFAACLSQACFLAVFIRGIIIREWIHGFGLNWIEPWGIPYGMILFMTLWFIFLKLACQIIALLWFLGGWM